MFFVMSYALPFSQGGLGNEEEPTSGSNTECYSDPPSSVDTPVHYYLTTDCIFIHRSTLFVSKDGSSSSSGSQEMTSGDGSSSDPGGMSEVFNHGMEHNRRERSPVNEVVCGHKFPSSFLPDQVSNLL